MGLRRDATGFVASTRSDIPIARARHELPTCDFFQLVLTQLGDLASPLIDGMASNAQRTRQFRDTTKMFYGSLCTHIYNGKALYLLGQ